MTGGWFDAVIQHREEMRPIPTKVQPRLKPLGDVKAFIFDVYGTLVISGSGDVGSADSSDQGEHLRTAIESSGIEWDSAQPPTIDDLHQTIRLANEQRLGEFCSKPEVEMIDIWRTVLDQCGLAEPSARQVCRLAAEFEALANPTWPMPGAAGLLRELSALGKTLGIVSNAQGFTLPLVEELGGCFGADSVFDANLCVFSNRYRQAKPAPRLFEVLSNGLSDLGIDSNHAIYVGNDRLNDIWAAAQAGMRTAWFVGDRRSMRARQTDPRVGELQHDVVITELQQLLECI